LERQLKNTNYNPVKTLRVSPEILDQIPKGNFSNWVLSAIKAKLESEKGLTPAYEQRLSLLLQELTALGRNINQLTRSANSGRPVSLDDRITKDLLLKLASLKQEVLEVKQKL
jgi:hypothetical protein